MRLKQLVALLTPRTPHHLCLGNGGRGFTLVEMLVSVTIISMISAILMYQYTAFDSQLLLRNMAYEIALTIRQAQRLGTGVQQDGSGNYNRPYGVRFVQGDRYQLFRDANLNGRFDNGEALTTFYLSRRNRISGFCYNTSQCTGISSLEFLFVRPDPDARIIVNGAASAASSASIQLSSDGGNLRTVTVSVTGQIAIQ